MASGASEVVSLRRNDTGRNWGFRMMGGRELELPLFIAQVNPKGIAGKAGLCPGDAILMICKTPVMGWTHQAAKSEMMRAGNEVDLTVQRGAVDVKDPEIRARCGQKGDERSELVEESINPNMNDNTKYRNVTPKTYKILEQQLNSSDPPPSAMAAKQPAQPMPAVHAQHAAPPAASGSAAKPASIFDRKKNDRSEYLVSQGNTYQKVFGQQ